MNVSLLISVEMSQESAGKQTRQSVDYTFKILRSKLSAKAVKHVAMNYETWLQFAESQVKTSTEDVICHIQQFQNQHDSLLFVHFDSSAILPATSVASAVGRDELLDDWWKPLNESAYVRNIISAAESKSDLSIITSSTLKNKIWNLCFTDERSLRMESDEFSTFMLSVGTLKYSHFDPTVNDLVVTQSAPSNQEPVHVEREVLSSNVEMNAVASTLFRVMNTSKGLSDGVVTATSSLKASLTTLKDLKDDFDGWKGPMAEATIRQLVSKREGNVWAEAKRLRSLDDVLWIGKGIGATMSDIEEAREMIVSALIFDFAGFDEHGTGLVCRPHLTGTK